MRAAPGAEAEASALPENLGTTTDRAFAEMFAMAHRVAADYRMADWQGKSMLKSELRKAEILMIGEGHGESGSQAFSMVRDIYACIDG